MENDSLKTFINISPIAVIGVDRSGIINIFNEAAVNLLGHSARDLIGKENISIIYGSIKKGREIKKQIYETEYGGQKKLLNYETEVISTSGNPVPIFLSAIIVEKDGVETGSIGFFQDLTKVKNLEKKLREQSITDSLTGLYNHRHFHVRLEEDFQRSKRYGRIMSLACFDLDKFKKINDIMGHLEGDTILRLAGSVIRSRIRKSDTGFRYGGDEFMIIFPETNAEDAGVIVDRIRVQFNNEYPFNDSQSDNYIPRVTLSIGLAELSASDTTETMVKRADLAMYEAKNVGGDRIIIASATINADKNKI